MWYDSLPMNEAIRVLREEHVVILKGVAVLESIADRVLAAAEIPEDDIACLMEFFHLYADGNHHAKEEGVLFPEIRNLGITGERGALSVLEDEHSRERGLIERLASSIGDLLDEDNAEHRSHFAEAARAFASFQRQHMHKENTVLFPVVDQVLSASDEPRILEAYAHYEQQGVSLEDLAHNIDSLAERYLD